MSSILDWLACLLVKAVGALFCRIPPDFSVWIGEKLGELAFLAQPRRARIGILNLRAAFDGQPVSAKARRVINGCFRQLGAALIELLRLPVIDRAYVERYIKVDGWKHFEDAIASKKPIVLLSGHYGNWELSSIAAALSGYPIVALARAQDNLPRLYKLLVSYRESKGCKIIHKGGAMKRLISALEAGELVGIVGDQASRQGIFVDFFGRSALFATGPFELALSRDALILPAFIHRVRGPFHKVVIEPPITLARDVPKDKALKQGIERFAELLSIHIKEDPSQWLWMHKRWKHTPSRRVLVLSDGKTGHLKQSLAVVEALREHKNELSHSIIEIRYRNALARAIALLWALFAPAGIGARRCLAWTLKGDSARSFLCRYADIIISCGASLTSANLLWSAENSAKSIVIMNPSPFPLWRFSLVIAPRHDSLPSRKNIVGINGAISRMRDGALEVAKERLLGHTSIRQTPQAQDERPAVAVFIGGDSAHYEISAAFIEALISQVKIACDSLKCWCLVTTSRRTSKAVERLLMERLSRWNLCRLLLIASRDELNGTMEGMLGLAKVAVVTGESISMVSEACASSAPVVVVEPPLKQVSRAGFTKHHRFLQDLKNEHYIRLVTVSELGIAIRRSLEERRSLKRLDSFSQVRDAVARLL